MPGPNTATDREWPAAVSPSPTPSSSSYPRPSPLRYGVSAAAGAESGGEGQGVGFGGGGGGVSARLAAARGSGGGVGCSSGGGGGGGRGSGGEPEEVGISAAARGWQRTGAATPLSRGHRVGSSGGRNVSGTPTCEVGTPTLKHRIDIPPWDRTVDIVYHAIPRSEDAYKATRMEYAFHAARNVVYAAHGRSIETTSRASREKSGTGSKAWTWTDLSVAERLRICDLLIPQTFDRRKPIRLTRTHVTVDVWPVHSLQTLQPLLKHLEPIMKASFCLYADMLAVILVRFSFLLVVSPFAHTGSSINRLATEWLPRFGAGMQNLVVELDMSRHGWGYMVWADGLLPSGGVAAMQSMVSTTVATLLARDPNVDMENLVLLCRCFYGARRTSKNCVGDPDSPAMTPSTPSRPICPEEDIVSVLNMLVSLSGRVLSMRIAGLSVNLTYTLIHTIFNPPTKVPDLVANSYRIVPSTVWPRLASQFSAIDGGDGHIDMDAHVEGNDPAGLHTPRGAVMMPKPFIHPNGTIEIPRRELLGVPDEINQSTPETSFISYNETSRNSQDTTGSSRDKRRIPSAQHRRKESFHLMGKDSFTLLRRKESGGYTRPDSAASQSNRKPSLMARLRGQVGDDGERSPSPMVTPLLATTTRVETRDAAPSTPDVISLEQKESSGGDSAQASTTPRGSPPTRPRLASKKASFQQLRSKVSIPQLRHKLSALAIQRRPSAEPSFHNQQQRLFYDTHTPTSTPTHTPTTITATTTNDEEEATGSPVNVNVPAQGPSSAMHTLRKKLSIPHSLRRKASNLTATGPSSAHYANNYSYMQQQQQQQSPYAVAAEIERPATAASVRHYVPTRRPPVPNTNTNITNMNAALQQYPTTPSPTMSVQQQLQQQQLQQQQHYQMAMVAEDQVAHYHPTHRIEAELEAEDAMAQRRTISTRKSSWALIKRKASFLNPRNISGSSRRE